MELKSVKIGKYEIQYPIIQGGMGMGISLDKLAGNVSKEGGLGVISTVGTGYYQGGKYAKKMVDGRPVGDENLFSRDAIFEIIKSAKEISGGKPIAVNILYAINGYNRVLRDCCEAGADIIITGAGLPLTMPEVYADFPNVALVPIVSSAKALSLICKRWQKRFNKLPDAVILEGPQSGGHQGFTYEQCSMPEFQLENLIIPVVEEAKKWGNIPVFAAGGVWDHDDIVEMIKLGASGVQMATRFIATVECDANQALKEILIASKEEDILLIKSPVGYPARAIKTNLLKMVEEKRGPAIKCISNCVAPCNRGEEAKEVGYCISDRLTDAWMGNRETGLYFTGSNGYRADKIISVKELMKKLVHGENS